MSSNPGDSQYAIHPSDPEGESPAVDSPTAQSAQPVSSSEEGVRPQMTAPPSAAAAASSGAGGGSEGGSVGGSGAIRGPPPAGPGRGRHGTARAHRRREMPPPPPPPDFSDAVPADGPGLRIPVPSAAATETVSQVGATETVPAAIVTSQIRVPPGGSPDKSEQPSGRTGLDGGPDCAICLQSCIHPTQLPCQHVFCFLCAKGAIKNSRRCAMCRSEVPADYLDNPLLLNTEQLHLEMSLSDGYQWFYEGRNGWWKYDERTAADLEAAFTGGEKRAELLVAGYRYLVDFETMLQLRRSDPARRRRVKRDLASAAKKGVAGIRVGGEAEGEAALETALQAVVLTEGGGEGEQQGGGDSGTQS